MGEIGLGEVLEVGNVDKMKYKDRIQAGKREMLRKWVIQEEHEIQWEKY